MSEIRECFEFLKERVRPFYGASAPRAQGARSFNTIRLYLWQSLPQNKNNVFLKNEKKSIFIKNIIKCDLIFHVYLLLRN